MTIHHLGRDFGQRGFVRIPQLFTTQELSELRDEADAALTAEAGTKEIESADIVATVDAWEHNAAVRRLALHPRLGAIAEQLAGMPLRVWGGELLVKRGTGRPTGLHDDQTSELLNSRITLTAWVALVDVPVERGCLTFLPGSHRRGGQERIDLTGINLSDLVRSDARSYLFDYWPELRWVPRVTVPLRAGDATFHHRRIAHSAGPNRTPDDRLSVALTFTDADATYQPIPGHDPLSYQAGQPLPEERYPRLTH